MARHALSPVAPAINPVPLPEAIERGVFGYEDNGEPVSPSPEEVEAITAYHADRLMDLLDTRRATDSAVARAARSDRSPRGGRPGCTQDGGHQSNEPGFSEACVHADLKRAARQGEDTVT